MPNLYLISILKFLLPETTFEFCTTQFHNLSRNTLAIKKYIAPKNDSHLLKRCTLRMKFKMDGNLVEIVNCISKPIKCMKAKARSDSSKSLTVYFE